MSYLLLKINYCLKLVETIGFIGYVGMFTPMIYIK
jgi:hypothetical protein